MGARDMGAQASSPAKGNEEQAVRLFQKVHLPGSAGILSAFFKKMRENPHAPKCFAIAAFLQAFA